MVVQAVEQVGEASIVASLGAACRDCHAVLEAVAESLQGMTDQAVDYARMRVVAAAVGSLDAHHCFARLEDVRADAGPGEGVAPKARVHSSVKVTLGSSMMTAFLAAAMGCLAIEAVEVQAACFADEVDSKLGKPGVAFPEDVLVVGPRHRLWRKGNMEPGVAVGEWEQQRRQAVAVREGVVRFLWVRLMTLAWALPFVLQGWH